MATNTTTGSTLPKTNEGKRICQVIKVRPEHLEEYKKVHADVWPEVRATIRRANIVDYSIHFFEPMNLLIAHMRYIGPPENFESDMEKIKEDEKTRQWWTMTDGMQESFVPGAIGSEKGPGWWSVAEEVFRFEA